MSTYTSPGEDHEDRGHQGSPAPHDDLPRLKRRRTDSSRRTTQELGLMRDGVEHDVPRFVGSGSGIYFIRTVYQKLAKGLNSQSQALHGSLVPGEDDQIHSHQGHEQNNSNGNASNPSTINYWLPEELLSGDRADDDRAPFESLVSWTRPFFKHWHPAFPFLSGPMALRILEDISSYGIDGISPADAVIARSILSISLADSRHSAPDMSPIPHRLVFTNNASAISMIQFALALPASISNLQAVISVQLFLTSMLKFNIASRLGGVIVRMAFHLGLHRCPARFANFSATDSQMRRRVFWSMYCLERILCQSLGLPLDIRDDDVDVCYPGEETHTDRNHGIGLEPHVDQLRLLTLLSKHARIRGMILELRNKSLTHRHDTSEISIRVQAELATWYNNVEDMIELESIGGAGLTNETQPRAMISMEHKILLQTLNHESIISLNRPLMTSTSNKAASAAALQNCISSSRCIITILDEFRLRTPSSSGGGLPLQIPFLWPLCTWSAWMSCFILAYAAMEVKSMVPSAQRYAQKTLNILHHLSVRRTFWPVSCAEAVQQLTSALSSRMETLAPRSGQDGSIPMILSPHSITSDVATGGVPSDHGGQKDSGRHNKSTFLHTGHDGDWDREMAKNGSRTVSHSVPFTASIPPGGADEYNELYQANDTNLQMPENYDFDPLDVIDFSNFASANSDPGLMYGFHI